LLVTLTELLNNLPKYFWLVAGIGTVSIVVVLGLIAKVHKDWDGIR